MNPVEVRPEFTVVWPKLEESESTNNTPFQGVEVIWHNKKRICIDLDGVVCEYDFPKIVKKHFGVELKAHEIYAYDLPDVLGVKQVDINKMFEDQVYGSPCFIAGAIGALHGWMAEGHELLIFSNRVKYMGDFELVKWLIKYKIPFTGITDGYGEYDVHIDDSPAKLMSTNSLKKLLYTQPWNERCLNITGKLIRVNNWEEVRDYV